MNLGEIKLKSQSSEHWEASTAINLLSGEHREHQEKQLFQLLVGTASFPRGVIQKWKGLGNHMLDKAYNRSPEVIPWTAARRGGDETEP